MICFVQDCSVANNQVADVEFEKVTIGLEDLQVTIYTLFLNGMY